MKLHIGCGSIFLEGYKNIDLPGPHTFLAKDRPDLVEKWQTTEENYYGKQKATIETLRKGPVHQDTVCDAFGSFDNIPAAYWSVAEVLTRNVFEHLSLKEAHHALDQVDAIMQPNGILRIDVPDHEESLKMYRKTGDEFYVRHLLGPRNSEYGYHLVGYTRESLRALVESHGFVFESVEPTIHFYPSICLRFTKPGPRAPRDYVKLPPIQNYWKVLDIGPGAYPLPRADVYLDYDIEKLTPLSANGKSTILGDVQTALSHIPDKAYDFVWASHCFEHFADPLAAAATVSRIGKRGCMIVPSAWKESLTNFEESGHLWQCLPNPNETLPPIFVRTNGQVDRIRNADTMKSLSRIFRTGPNRIPEEQRQLRRWWYRNEAALDVIYFWEGELKLQVIG